MVIETDQPGALGDKQMLPGLRVEDGLADLRDELPWEVRIEARQEHRGDDGPRLYLVPTHLFTKGRGENLRTLRRRRRTRSQRHPNCRSLGRGQRRSRDDRR